MIIGREKELDVLRRILESQKAEFLAIYGRRRIGKTYLIHEFFKDKGFYFEITGSHNISKKEQLKNFNIEFRTLFSKTLELNDWSDAFEALLLEIKHKDQMKKFIFFIDELPWLAS